MHLSQLHNPHANQLDEHYCRRWISINLIRQLKAHQGVDNTRGPIAGAQVSRYWGTPNAYLCITIAKPEHREPENSSSVTIGLLINGKLKRLFRFLEDPKLSAKDVHTTCERCGILDCGGQGGPSLCAATPAKKGKNKSHTRKTGGKSGKLAVQSYPLNA